MNNNNNNNNIDSSKINWPEDREKSLSSLEGKLITSIQFQLLRGRRWVWRKTIEKWPDPFIQGKKIGETCHISQHNGHIVLRFKEQRVVEDGKVILYKDSKVYGIKRKEWLKMLEEQQCSYCNLASICFCAECGKKLCQNHVDEHMFKCDHLSPCNKYT